MTPAILICLGHLALLENWPAWINQNSFYKRERIAASAAIMAIGNLGMHYRDDITSVAPNLMFLCVAGSGTGKEAVQSRFGDIMRSGNMQTAIHGDIKSKQEIIPQPNRAPDRGILHQTKLARF